MSAFGDGPRRTQAEQSYLDSMAYSDERELRKPEPEPGLCGVCGRPFPCETPDACERAAVLADQLGGE